MKTKKSSPDNHLLNDLPKYSDWPSRMLGLSNWDARKKNHEQIDREYNEDKWGHLLNLANDSVDKITLKEIMEWEYGECLDGIVWHENLKFMNYLELHAEYLRIIIERLLKYNKANTIIEFGAGYGSIILNIAKNVLFKSSKIIAGEITPNGKKLMRSICSVENLHDIEIVHCDLSSKDIANILIPKDSIIFTSFAACCVPKFSYSFIERIINFCPKVVIHFEPIYEFCNEDDLLGLMRKKYIEMNDYNKNLYSIIEKGYIDGKLDILNIEKNLIGANPFLVASIVEWSPNV